MIAAAARTGGARVVGVTAGIAHCHAHHGELFQGVVASASGRVPALLTLPCRIFGSTAIFVPNSRSVIRSATDTGAHAKAVSAARATARFLGLGDLGGELSIVSSIPRGRGLGSSTADVLAAARAVANAANITVTAEALATIAVHAEGASDALMWDRPVLFAHRHGRMLVDYRRGLPPFRVVGVDLDPNGRGVDTDTLERPRYPDDELDLFAAMAAGLKRAIVKQDAALLARVATLSALIDQRYRHRPALDSILRECERRGALGAQIAHSGTVVGVIVPAARDARDPIDGIAAWLEDICQTPTWKFEV